MRVIGYLQMRAVGPVVEGAAFGEQDQQLHRWADRHGHDVVRIVIERCSTDTPGPGLSGAVRAVQAGEADALVVTSRGRLRTDRSPRVRILAVDEPEPVTPPVGPARTAQRRAHVRSLAATWAALAVAALGAHGVAGAASGDSPTSIEGKCVSARYEVVPCDANAMALVTEVLPPTGECGYAGRSYRRPDGTTLCLQYR